MFLKSFSQLRTYDGRADIPNSNRTLSQAQTLEPNNPRVLLIEAISAFNTPAAYGGSMLNTIQLTSKAIDLFAEPCDNICWGHAEAYTWRGLAKQSSGDSQGAIDDWQAALSVQADYGWAHFLLKKIAKLASNTNQHKDEIAQRDISASEARQRVKGIVTLRASSLTQHMKR